ncbi:hypothetical protein EC951288_1102B, partial [Escherichia coli 95.1288]
TSRR